MSILTGILCVVVGIFIAACIIDNCNESKFDETMHDICIEQFKRS